MMKSIGTLITEPVQEILDRFIPVEGQVSCYYGRIRNGKTYSATADIIDLLEQGEVVYANWYVDFSGFDQRQSFFVVLLKLFFGQKYFYKFDKSNFHYFDPDNPDIGMLGSLVNVHIFVDEGQWIFNSHTKDHDPEKRKLILHNGHYCRSLNIVTQRPVNIFKDIRSQVHVWFKCEKRLQFGSFIVFQRTAFEDMINDLPDEEMPSGRPKIYVAKSKVLNAYSTHARRSEDAIEEFPAFEVYSTTWFERLKLLFSFFTPRRALKRPRGVNRENL